MSTLRFENAVLETNAVALMHIVSELNDQELANLEEWTFLKTGEAAGDEERVRFRRANQVAVCEIVRRFRSAANVSQTHGRKG